MKSKIDIPFNKPFLVGKELDYIKESVSSGKIAGDGIFTQKCREFFNRRYGFRDSFLTTSCTDALEMTAILANIGPEDEVIVPSYTFVSTANAFVLRGAKIVFVDSEVNTPNLDAEKIEELVSGRTKAIVPVHYAGVACDMDKILDIAERYQLLVIEDAAQAIESYYKGIPLGTLGQLSTFSFHETKNVISGEGGLLAINDPGFIKRAEIIREKGTNRSAFFRGEIDKYGWVDIGSSFLPSEIVAAFLYAQLERIDSIQEKRRKLWFEYENRLQDLEQQGKIVLPKIPEYASNNGHAFYILCDNSTQRDDLIRFLENAGILAVFHYQSLHKSDFYQNKHDGRTLSNADRYSECLLRLPMFYELTTYDIEVITNKIHDYFG